MYTVHRNYIIDYCPTCISSGASRAASLVATGATSSIDSDGTLATTFTSGLGYGWVVVSMREYRTLPSELTACTDGTYRLWGEVKIGEGVQLNKELLHQFLNLSVPLILLVLLHCLHMQR